MSRAEHFTHLPPARLAHWSGFMTWERQGYQRLLGFELEELRTDYCRMRMPYRPELDQAAGVVHGGSIASLIDTVVVPAIGSGYDGEKSFSTVDMQVQYLAALIADDAVAEGWIVRRGRSIAFCEAEVVAGSTGKLVARGLLTYFVTARR